MAPLALTTGPSVDIHPCELSGRSFDFFVQRTSSELAGLFGSAFWERLVLQAAYYEPAIRYAITAIGSLHENKKFGRDVKSIFALKQYNLAIKSLLAPPPPGQERGLDVSLISCILFTCFENMQGHHAIAESHIRSGSKLLKGIVRDQQNDALQNHIPAGKCQLDGYAPLESLAAIFAVLDIEAAIITRDYKSPNYDSYFAAIINGDAEFEISTIEEARDMFEYSLYSFSGSGSAELQDQVHYIKTLITKFSTAVRTFVETREPFLTPREKVSAAAMQLHVLHSYVTFYINYVPPAYRPTSSELLSNMKETVSICEKIIGWISSRTGSASQQFTFCLDYGYVIPLYTVASRCPEMATRRRAIDLLRSAPRQEGLWNSLVVARAAERILEIEESTGEQLVPCAPAASLSSQTGARAVLQVDSMGARLEYADPGQDDGAPVCVVEELATW